MPIESIYEPEVYTLNGTTDEFAVGFLVSDATFLKCTRIDAVTGAETDLVLNTDFSYSGVGATSGTLTYPITGAPDDDATLVIELDIPPLQGTDFGNQGGFFAENHTAAFDKVTQILQIFLEALARTVKVPITSDTDPADLIQSLTEAAATAVAAAATAVSAADTTLAASLASQSDAEAGTNNTMFMSPLRVVQARRLIVAPGADHSYSGIPVTLTAKESQAFGDVCRIGSDGKATLAKGDAIANAGVDVMCVSSSVSADAAGDYILVGVVRDDTWAWTVGGLVYLSATGTSGNTLTQTAPTAADSVTQIVGKATHADRMIFKPELMQIEHV